MASIYDIARIQSGDPLGTASDASKEALTKLAQYSKQKDIIDKINDAMADAERKAQKKKGAYGVGGSILGTLTGMLLTAATGGLGAAAAPWLIGGLSSGIGAGLAEKRRQDVHDPAKKLKKLKEELAGTKYAGEIQSQIDTIEEGEKKMFTDDVMMSAIFGAVMPGGGYGEGMAAKTAGKRAAEEATEESLDALIQAGVDAGTHKATGELTKAGIEAAAKPLNIGIDAFKERAKEEASAKVLRMGQTGVDIAEVKTKIPGIAKEMLRSGSVWYDQLPLLASLIGPELYSQKNDAELVLDPFYQDPFTNPFRGGY